MRIKTMGELGALVRTARTARRMTQAELAARLHTSRDWVVRLEKGHPRLEAQRVLDALRVVGVTLDATLEAPPGVTHRGSSEIPGLKAGDDPFDALFGEKKR